MVAGLTISLLVAGCGEMSTLDPRGPAAERIADLWWFMFWTATAIFVGVMGLLLWALFRRRSEQTTAGRSFGGLGLIVGGGIVLPVIVLSVLFGLTLMTLRSLTVDARSTTLTVEVAGQQWWWEVRYPDQQFVTANQIHIPVGQPVRLLLTSRDVVHNFWVPQLHGKMDLLPGQTNVFWLQADEPGVYRGVCAEYCGLQHAKMEFLVVAEPADEFAAWLARQQEHAAAPADRLAQEGQQIFLRSGCVSCHAVRGTNATSTVGPDLTHLASRRTLAAGVLDNNRGNLAGWIMNPQTIKPGNKMPPTQLTAEELLALLAYLEQLK